jgi:hypothetical protein
MPEPFESPCVMESIQATEQAHLPGALERRNFGCFNIRSMNEHEAASPIAIF